MAMIRVLSAVLGVGHGRHRPAAPAEPEATPTYEVDVDVQIIRHPSLRESGRGEVRLLWLCPEAYRAAEDISPMRLLDLCHQPPAIRPHTVVVDPAELGAATARILRALVLEHQGQHHAEEEP
jgi:hypothetical protein